MSFDTERVIVEVLCRPNIWNKADELYKDRDARTAAWLQICKEIFENFEHFSEVEKKTMVIKVQGRWKTARDTYIKVKQGNKKLKSGSAAKASKKYAYYNMLTFLDANASNDAEESVEIIDTRSEDQDSTTNTTNDILVPNTSIKNPEPTITESSRKRKRQPSPTPFEKELLESIKHNNLLNDDEDLTFFKSLIPTVKKFCKFKKLLFRTKILEALIEIERENIITLDDLPSFNMGTTSLSTTETQNTISTIDLASLNINTEHKTQIQYKINSTQIFDRWS